jgi:hypothetical protein
MTHAQIAAEARRPYAAKIARDQASIETLRDALATVLDTLAVYRGNALPRCLDHIEATALLAIEQTNDYRIS